MYSTLSHYSTCLAKTFLSWNKLFYVVIHRFCGMLNHPKSVYFGEITRVMRHICIFLAIFFRRQFFPGCYCRLPARMLIWLVVESISVCYVLYFTWYDSTKYALSLKAVFSFILFSHKFYFLRSFSQAFLDIQP